MKQPVHRAGAETGHATAITIVALAGVAVVGTLWVTMMFDREPHEGGRGAATTAVSAPRPVFAGSIRPTTMPPIEFRLIDERGRAISARRLRGRPLVVAFLYATCRDTCPLIANQIRGALDRLGPRRERSVRTVAISVDPAGDRPRAIRSFLARHDLRGRMRYLVGPRTALGAAWRRFAVRPQSVDREHSAIVVLVDADGRQRTGYSASTLTPEALAADIAVLIGQGAGRPR